MSVLHVRVGVAGEHYALPVVHVLEVAELGEVTPVPGAGAAVIGVRNLRGQVLPVVSLGTMLDLPLAEPTGIVVAEHGGRTAALAVDSVLGVEPLPEATQETDLPHLAGAALADGVLVGVVDVGSVLDVVEASTPT